jgi:cobalt-zinc-cadmium efflux system outer membrane protein
MMNRRFSPAPLLLALGLAALGRPARAAEGLTLDAALRRALAASPEVAAAEADVAGADGRRVTAEAFPHDPELSGEAGARLGPGDPTLDWSVGLAQTFALGGRVGHARAAVLAELAAARARVEVARRAVSTRVHVAFVEALRARDLLAVEAAQIDLARGLLGVATKRFEAGASTRLDVNLARVEVGRAEGRLHAARARADVACALLAEALGDSPARGVTPEGTLDAPPEAANPALPDLLETARAHRAELIGAGETRRAARSRVERAAAESVPDLTVSGFFRREAGVESIVGLGLAIPLPITDRATGGVAEAEADALRLEADTRALTARIDREVIVALAELQASHATATALQAQIVGSLGENLALLQSAFEAGKIAGAELLVFRQQFRESHVELIEARAAEALARVQLEAALGRALDPKLAASAAQESL